MSASPSRPQRKRKKIDYAEANYNWSEHQQLVKALTLSLKNEPEEEEESSSAKKQQQNKIQPKKSAATNTTTKPLNANKSRRRGDEVSEEPQNCMVRLTRLQKMLHDTLVRDGKELPDKKQTEKSSKIQQDDAAEGNSNDDKNVAVSKYRAQRKFAPNGHCDISTKPRGGKSRANQKKRQKVYVSAPKTRPKNIICEKSPDTATFLDYLCYRGTEFEPDLDA